MKIRVSDIIAKKRLKWVNCKRIHYNATSPKPSSLSSPHVLDKDWLSEQAFITQYSSKPQHSVKLQDLVRFGKRPILERDILDNATSTLERIIIRLADRLAAMRQLPFLVILNPHISRIYNLYLSSMRALYSWQPPKSMHENHVFVEKLESLLAAHSDTIPFLSKGFNECSRYIDAKFMHKYIDKHLRTRIGTRLLAEHHIALTKPTGSTFIGVVDTQCCPADILERTTDFVGDMTELKYAVSPSLQIDTGKDIRFAYVPSHIEYIFTELIKNSFRATIEAGRTEHHPVIVTIIKVPCKSDETIIVRVRDRGTGIDSAHQQRIWSYAYSTFQANEGTGFTTLNTPPGDDGANLAGQGYGLPLSRAYAEFFGGSLSLQSYPGWGTDVYLTLHGPNIVNGS